MRPGGQQPPPPVLSEVLAGRAGLKKGRSSGSTPTDTSGSPVPAPPPGPSRFGPPRKGALDVAQRRLKNLQWEMISVHAINDTIWGKAAADDSELSQLLRQKGIFDEMEESFTARQLARGPPKRQGAALASYLNPQQRQRIEISLLKSSSTAEDPNERVRAAAERILRCDDDMTESFLTELKALLPDAAQVGNLNVFCEAPPESLDTLQPADRFVVQLLKMHRWRQRVDGLLFRAKFDENIHMLERDAARIHSACERVLNAPRFAELLRLILIFGNFLNSTGRKGGAFGFKVRASTLCPCASVR